MSAASYRLWRRLQIYQLDWLRFDDLCDELFSRITESQFVPDVVIGIARGGMIPSVRLSHLLNIQAFGTISILRNTTSDPLSDRRPPTILGSCYPPVRGKRVLIVDDIAGSGDTFHAAKDAIGDSARQIKTASLIVNTQCRLRPDYFSYEVDDWVVFPWEVSRTAKSSDLHYGLGVQNI